MERNLVALHDHRGMAYHRWKLSLARFLDSEPLDTLYSERQGALADARH